MAPSGGDVYNVRANGGKAAGERERIRESHKNTLKTSRIQYIFLSPPKQILENPPNSIPNLDAGFDDDVSGLLMVPSGFIFRVRESVWECLLGVEVMFFDDSYNCSPNVLYEFL